MSSEVYIRAIWYVNSKPPSFCSDVDQRGAKGGATRAFWEGGGTCAGSILQCLVSLYLAYRARIGSDTVSTAGGGGTGSAKHPRHSACCSGVSVSAVTRVSASMLWFYGGLLINLTFNICTAVKGLSCEPSRCTVIRQVVVAQYVFFLIF